MDKLNGRGAVVVGGGSGIGCGIALGLASEGMRVLVADIDGESAGAVRDEIVRRGGDACVSRVDATDRDSLAELAAGAAGDLDGVHVLVNTVGVHTNARFGGPMPDPMAGRELPPDSLLSMMSNEAVGPIVVRGIRDNRGYIITHPEMEGMVRARQQQLLEDFAFFAAT